MYVSARLVGKSYCAYNIFTCLHGLLLKEPTSDGISTDFGAGQHMVIWGTDVIVDHCKKKFTKFLHKFVNTEVDEDETLNDMEPVLPFYMAKLEEVRLN